MTESLDEILHQREKLRKQAANLAGLANDVYNLHCNPLHLVDRQGNAVPLHSFGYELSRALRDLIVAEIRAKREAVEADLEKLEGRITVQDAEQ